MGSLARLCSTIREQDFNQNVEEVAYSIFLAVYWPIAQNVGTCLRNKDEIYSLIVLCNVFTPTRKALEFKHASQ